MKKKFSVSQLLPWVLLVLVIVSVIVAGIVTNVTLRSVEKNLPGILLRELNDLSFVLENLSDIVHTASITKDTPSLSNLNLLQKKINSVYEDIVNLRESYVFDNLVQASAFHSVVAPAIADLQIWLAEGVSGLPPGSKTVATIMFLRIDDAYQKALLQNRKSRIIAQKKLIEQQNRLGDFVSNANLLFILTIIVVFSIVYLLIQQYKLQIRESKAQSKLQESEKKYRELSDSLPQVVFEIDETGRFTYVNQNTFDLFGYTNDEFEQGINFIQIIIPEDHDRAIKNMQSALKGNQHGGIEYTALKSNGTTLPVVIHSRPISHNTEIIGLRGLLIDISNQKKMETDLKRRALAMDYSSDTILITDPKGSIIYVNSAFEKITGYSYEEALETNPNILKSGKHDKAFYKELWETISNGKIWSGRLINLKKNGEQYTEEASISPVFSNKGEIVNYVAVKRDITEKLKLESQLQQAHKLESIGTLAGGIAHDFNNILFPIVGHSEMLLEDIPEYSPFRGGVNAIFQSALRAKDLVKQILTFSRQEDSDLKLMKIQPIIKEALRLIRSTIPTTIEIKQDIQTDCGLIKADPTQIHQVIMNLATNAYHAMEDSGGELKINLKEIELGEYDVLNSDMETGTYACLTIADTGIGMDNDLTHKIFDPFFTTKEQGKGTGMGLSVVHGIVKHAGGSIQFYSNPGKGAEFNIYFPIENGSFEKQIDQTKEPIQNGSEQILLIDDEKSIITMVKQNLERLGYQVTSRTSSVEALEAFRTTPGKFDIVITDMAMPNLPGDKLSIELIKIRPNIPILLCTGFSNTMSEEKAKSLGIKGFLLKPVVINELSHKIREVLDKNI